MSPSPEVGSAADEAARLADALGGWFRSAATGSAQSHSSDHDPLTCRACPICRGIAAARAVQPEVIAYLATAADALAAALREWHARQPESADRTTCRDRPETVRINIDDDDEGAA